MILLIAGEPGWGKTVTINSIAKRLGKKALNFTAPEPVPDQPLEQTFKLMTKCNLDGLDEVLQTLAAQMDVLVIEVIDRWLQQSTRVVWFIRDLASKMDSLNHARYQSNKTAPPFKIIFTGHEEAPVQSMEEMNGGKVFYLDRPAWTLQQLQAIWATRVENKAAKQWINQATAEDILQKCPIPASIDSWVALVPQFTSHNTSTFAQLAIQALPRRCYTTHRDYWARTYGV
eukprot:TRINITY_DN52273_c0_g1_i2.p1 TRINITY_DN52273_c0_g1~~TRINITY_DN52273_c0_g1_i2.p1  ORF type:complete len:230 (-),score=23.36 TRINITY_DN52273_c0_g1_i2:141-830(-)